jgi:diguanylate cyclase (GGDEF)-like protein
VIAGIMDYVDYDNEMLIMRIRELELLTQELLLEKEADTGFSFPWTGNLGNFYINPETGRLICSDQLIHALGYERRDIPADAVYRTLLGFVLKEDQERVKKYIQRVYDNHEGSFETEFRMKNKADVVKWFYVKSKVRYDGDKGSPMLISGILFDISEKKRQELSLSRIKEALAKSSTLDETTGMLNHRSILRELEKAIIESTMFRSPLSVILLDLDNFSEIKGSDEGHRVLKAVVQLMGETLRANDVAGRTGGTEFLIVLPQTIQSDARTVAERIRNKIAEARLMEGITLTVSAGCVQRKSEDEKEILESAKRKLLDARALGRNRVSS